MSRFEIVSGAKNQYEIDQLNAKLFEIKDVAWKQKPWEHWGRNTNVVVINIMRLGAFIVIAQMIVGGTMSYAQLITISLIMSYLNSLMVDLRDLMTSWYKSFVEVEKLRRFTEKTPQILGYSIGSTFQPKSGEIAIKNLEYGYTNGTTVFFNFSLPIPGGSRIALVGPSGGGKTTLVKLIAGYLHPQSGEILVDGQALPTPQNVESGNHISLQSYYPHIGYLTQEPSVFDGTVWENLTYGIDVPLIKGELKGDQKKSLDRHVVPPHNDEDLENKIERIIKLARCEFVYEFKDGLQTEIGEKGIRLLDCVSNLNVS